MTSSFYGKIYSARYDHNEERFDLLDFYLDRRRQAGKPEPVLEPMCGTDSEHDEGRVGRCLAKQERFVASQLVETELFDYHERLYDQKEFEGMLQTAGFTHIKATIGYETTEQQDILVFSCRKPDISANRQAFFQAEDGIRDRLYLSNPLVTLFMSGVFIDRHRAGIRSVLTL